MLQAAKTASRYDPRLSEKIKIQVGMYRNTHANPGEEIKALYLRIEDVFYQLYLKKERDNTILTVIDDNRFLKYLLTEMGYRIEWDDKRFAKMLKRGKEIARNVKGSF